MPKYIGPFPVTRVVNPVAVQVELPLCLKIHDVFHVSLVYPYYPDGNIKPPPPPVLVDGDWQWEVEQILQHEDRYVGRNKKWFNYIWSNIKAMMNLKTNGYPLVV